MKTQGTAVTAALLLITVLSAAQTNHIRPIAKEVQKINNKTWLKTQYLLTVPSVAYAPISKDVQLISNRSIRKGTPGNVVSTGYPLWTISKGVQRLSWRFRGG